MKKIKLKSIINTFLRGLLAIFVLILIVFPLYLACRISCYLNPKKTIYLEFAFACKEIISSLVSSYDIFGEIPDDENFVIVCNHQSFLDVFAITVYFNGTPGVVFLDQKMFNWPILSFFLEKIGAISINGKLKPEDNVKERSSAVWQSIKILRTGKHLFIFQEGTRTETGELSEFFHGASAIARRTGKKILTLGLAGAFEVSNKKSFLLNSGKIVLYTGPIIDPKDYSQEELTEVLRVTIEENIIEAEERKNKLYNNYIPIIGDFNF